MSRKVAPAAQKESDVRSDSGLIKVKIDSDRALSDIFDFMQRANDTGSLSEQLINLTSIKLESMINADLLVHFWNYFRNDDVRCCELLGIPLHKEAYDERFVELYSVFEHDFEMFNDIISGNLGGQRQAMIFIFPFTGDMAVIDISRANKSTSFRNCPVLAYVIHLPKKLQNSYIDGLAKMQKYGNYAILFHVKLN
jgi:hypothetical protein